jgi:hypothetical protein
VTTGHHCDVMLGDWWSPVTNIEVTSSNQCSQSPSSRTFGHRGLFGCLVAWACVAGARIAQLRVRNCLAVFATVARRVCHCCSPCCSVFRRFAPLCSASRCCFVFRRFALLLRFVPLRLVAPCLGAV